MENLDQFTVDKFEDLKGSEGTETQEVKQEQTAEELGKEIDEAIERLENPKI